MKKTDRKNKTGLVINWPTNVFTINELNALNSDFVTITLRVRLKNHIDNGEVNVLGTIPNGKGRPTNVYVHGVVTDDHVEEAKNRGVLLKEGLVVSMQASVEATEKVVDTHEVEVQDNVQQSVE